MFQKVNKSPTLKKASLLGVLWTTRDKHFSNLRVQRNKLSYGIWIQHQTIQFIFWKNIEPYVLHAFSLILKPPLYRKGHYWCPYIIGKKTQTNSLNWGHIAIFNGKENNRSFLDLAWKEIIVSRKIFNKCSMVRYYVPDNTLGSMNIERKEKTKFSVVIKFIF